MRRGAALITIALLALAATPASAASGIFTQVQRVYGEHGRIPPCQFSSQQLEAALKGVDTYGAQYFADLSSAIQAALSARATGACSPGGAARPVASGGAGGAQPLRLGPVTAATGSDLPAPILLMALLIAVLGIGGLLAGVVWWRGWSPPAIASWRHMWADARYRARGSWLDFTDRLKSRSG